MFTQKECDQLNASKAQVKALWIRACIVEGIEPTSRFVIFSGDNQAANDHNQAMGVHFDLLQRIRKNEARRAKHAAYTDLGLKRVKGALGGVYYE